MEPLEENLEFEWGNMLVVQIDNLFVFRNGLNVLSYGKLEYTYLIDKLFDISTDSFKKRFMFQKIKCRSIVNIIPV